MKIREGRAERRGIRQEERRLTAYYTISTKLMQCNGSMRFNKTDCRNDAHSQLSPWEHTSSTKYTPSVGGTLWPFTITTICDWKKGKLIRNLTITMRD
jgi:hypothetical protein